MDSPDEQVRPQDFAKVLIGMTVESVGVGNDRESIGPDEGYIVVTLRRPAEKETARLYADAPSVYLNGPEARSPRASAPGGLRVDRRTE